MRTQKSWEHSLHDIQHVSWAAFLRLRQCVLIANLPSHSSHSFFKLWKISWWKTSSSIWKEKIIIKFTQWAGVLYQVLKHKAQPSVLELDTPWTANFVNYLIIKNFAVYLSILTLIFTGSLQVILAKKIGHKI